MRQQLRGVLTRLRSTVAALRAGPMPDGAEAGRPVPFAPQGKGTPLFFMHVPKTSGTSTNAMLREAYGVFDFQEHIEHLLSALRNGRRPTLRMDCLSGHVPLALWSSLNGQQAYARVTLLRDPWARLVSHVNWVHRFNLGQPLPQGGTGPGTGRVARALAATDFSSRDSIAALRDLAESEPKFNSFDNLQTRMLLQGKPGASYKSLRAADLEKALASLQGFALVGLCEAQSDFAVALSDLIGRKATLPPQAANVTQDHQVLLGRDNDLAREVLSPWIAQDQQVYDAVVSGAFRADSA